jgi:hypothetical protein
MKYDSEKRIFMVQKYYDLKKIILVQRAFRTKYAGEKAPDHKTIKYYVAQFEKDGSVSHNRSKPKQISAKREEAKSAVEQMFEEFPQLSIRKAASALTVSPTLVYHILHEDLHFKPYKLHSWHKLKPEDFPKRLKFAEWFSGLPPNHKFFFIFSDEAYFYLTLPKNKQNNRIWGKSNPYEGIEEPLNDEKVLVWCAIWSGGIYGPYFFEENVNSVNYLEMLQKFFWPRHSQIPNPKKFYFQQDGASPHTADVVQTWLKGQFGKLFIDKESWPPRSPDLNPCDFYLWGHLKALVYNPLPKTLDDLKANISREITKIPEESLKNVFFELEKRCKLLESAQGGHIEIN